MELYHAEQSSLEEIMSSLEPLSQATDRAFYEHGGDAMLLEVARCRADSDSEEAPAVRQRAWRATLSAARVTPSKILLPKMRPPAPATAGARPAFQDDSARKPSEPSARERSPETSPRAPLEEGDFEDFFCSPQSSVGAAAAALEGLAEQLRRVKRAGTSRARSGTRKSLRFARSASPPPAPPPSRARSPRRAAAGELRADADADENAPIRSPRSTASPRTPIRPVRRGHSGVADPAPTPASPHVASAHGASVRRRLDAPPRRDGASTARRGKAPREATPSATPRGVSSKRKRRSVETAARVAHLTTTFTARETNASKASSPSKEAPKTMPALTRERRGAYDDDELASLREKNPAAYNRILGNRRSAANSKARRDAVLERMREENARLREENARLLARATKNEE